MKCSMLLLVIVSGFNVVKAQSISKNEGQAIFPVGYQNMRRTDSGRTYKPGAGHENPLFYRPVEIDIWYPAANPASDSLIEYGDFVNMLEQRSNRFQRDTEYSGMTAELIQYLCANLKIRDTSTLMRLKTGSYRNAKPIGERFPLILYSCSYNGMGYENLNLFERLASHGYVVASITSVGRYPGNMSTDPADLLEQADDESFAIKALKYCSNIDSSKIGAIGYSWGSLPVLCLAMQHPEIKAVLSLDGSEMHYYGESKEEDKDFDRLRALSFFQPGKIASPLTYLESGFKQTGRLVDSIYNILPFLTAQKGYIHFAKASHEDFSCIPSLPEEIGGTTHKVRPFYAEVILFALNYFDQYLKDQLNPSFSRLGLLFKQESADSVYPRLSKSINYPELVIQGRIADFKTKEPIAYVNVGVLGKNIGTVTQADGSFLIRVHASLLADSIKISMVGYQSQTYQITNLLKDRRSITILLNQRMAELHEIVVSARALKSKRLGNTSTSRFISVGFPLKLLGGETGIRIGLGKNPMFLKTFNFTISDNRLDTAVFRVNIYNFKKGRPSENILQKNILIRIGKQTGAYTVNLSEYRLVMSGDILISLEWIGGATSSALPGAIFLSAGLLNTSTWHRQTSQGEWKKLTGIGVGFNVLAQSLNH